MDELIRRSDAIEVIKRCKDRLQGKGLTYEIMLDMVERIPSADRPQGEWLPFEFGDERWHKCSCCGTADKYIEYVPRPNGTVGKLVSIRNFCPNCGARMKGADDEDN